MTIVDDLEVCPLPDVFLRPLAPHPFEYFLTRDLVASHHTLNA